MKRRDLNASSRADGSNETKGGRGKRFESDDERARTAAEGAIRRLGFGMVAGVILSSLYSVNASNRYEAFETVSTIVGIAAAFAFVGGLLGFLFGIPRALQRDDAWVSGRSTLTSSNRANPDTSVEPSMSATVMDQSRYRSNTNLEEISDWLTKILVGVGLTQIASMPDQLQALGEYMTPALGDRVSSEAFAVALIVTYLLAGFIFSYLWTRMYLKRALEVVDAQYVRQVAREEARIETQAQMKPTEERISDALSAAGQATVVANSAVTAVGHVRSSSPEIFTTDDGIALAEMERLANEYVQVQTSQQRGSARTRVMTEIVTGMMAEASRVQGFPLTQWLSEGHAGRRLAAYAYVYAHPVKISTIQDMKHLVESVRRAENTPFGWYWGLSAIKRVLNHPHFINVMNLAASQGHADLRSIRAEMEDLRDFIYSERGAGSDTYRLISEIVTTVQADP